MPISKSGGGVKVDKSACIPFGTPSSTFAMTTAYQVLQSISGKGYLDMAILAGQANGNYLRITVDGVVKFEGYSTVAIGFVNREFIVYGTNGLGIQHPSTPQLNHPFTGATTYGYPLYPAPALQTTPVFSVNTDSIYFSNSLVIEAKATSVNTQYYALSGGYQ